LKIRHLTINNFRGIQKLDWDIPQSFVCLVGQGDSTKSTILEAIQLCLSPMWALTFTDSDFYNCDINLPIEIITTVGELPDTMIDREKFGDYTRGWSMVKGLVDEPDDDSERVLSISLLIDRTLEPKWSVINDREPEGVFISANDRRKFGVSSLGTYVDQHLSWGKYSALSKLTGIDDEISSVLADASRSARKAVADASLSELNMSALTVKELGESFGVKPHSDYCVGLDAKLSITGQATLTLHDGQIPARMAGLGSRRLLTLAIQHESVPDGGIMLIDEIEAGLEPHRLRHLIRRLHSSGEQKQQVFLTTHSSVALVELNAEELCIVHNIDGIIEILTTSNALQDVVRKVPEAFLAIKIICCEGATEYGFLREFDRYWQSEGGGKFLPFAYLGVVPVVSTQGGGSDVPRISVELSKLGYKVLYFGDSDAHLSPSTDEMEAVGVTVFVWEGSKSIEERICLDLPFEKLDDFITGAVECALQEDKSSQSVYDSLGSSFGINSGGFKGVIGELIELGFSEDDIRIKLGKNAKDKCWFKRVSYGECLARIVTSNYDDLEGTDLRNKLTSLRESVNE